MSVDTTRPGGQNPTDTVVAPEPPAKIVRVGSVDAYRGFVMLLMMAEVLKFHHLADAFPHNKILGLLALHQTHVEWRGCSLHDLIQPSFSFLVGVALPFSLASRARRGQSTAGAILHAEMRAIILILLGIFLRSVRSNQTNYTFEDTLTQIGLGYFPLFLIGMTRNWVRWVALVVILVGYWGAFALYPLPGPNFDYAVAGVPADWPHHATGFAAHWNKNTNAAWAFDRWFLNRFPRVDPFKNNGGGYATLSFIPTLGTMILGLIAGGWLKGERRPWSKAGLMFLVGLIGLGSGFAADRYGICPSVKRIWTPSWVLFSGGWCFVLMSAFYVVIDVIGLRGWSYPLRVIGRNSIMAYMMAHLTDDFVLSSVRTHFGQGVFDALAEKLAGVIYLGDPRLQNPAALHALATPYVPFVTGVVLLTVYWLILYWMDRRRIYLRV